MAVEDHQEEPGEGSGTGGWAVGVGRVAVAVGVVVFACRVMSMNGCRYQDGTEANG